MADDPDFTKQTIIAEYVTQSLTLWDNAPKNAGDVTDAVDVSKVGSFGVYIKVSAATNIDLQVETIAGWDTYDTTYFTAAGSIFLDIWTLPFENIRFRTSAAATITIQVFKKT
jgi:hypothetical protein